MILARRGDLLRSAMGLHTFSHTISVCALKSALVRNRYLQGNSDDSRCPWTRCRCLGVIGSRVQISPARQSDSPSSHLVNRYFIQPPTPSMTLRVGDIGPGCRPALDRVREVLMSRAMRDAA